MIINHVSLYIYIQRISTATNNPDAHHNTLADFTLNECDVDGLENLEEKKERETSKRLGGGDME